MNYPKIPGPSDKYRGQCIVFEKLDGSNLGWEWNRDLGGFWRSTTRRREFDEFDPVFGPSVKIFQDKYAAQLHDIFSNDIDFRHETEIKAFFEYVGRMSFAGNHAPDDPLDLVLIDIMIGGVGLLGPEELVKKFSHLGVPKIIFKGKFGGQALERAQMAEGEGAVIKGGTTGNVWMCKVKTNDWLKRLEEAHHSGVWTDAAGRTHRLDEELTEQSGRLRR